MNKLAKSNMSQLVVSLAIVGFLLVVNEDPLSNSIGNKAQATDKSQPILTSSLVNWISRQAEGTINELEAIAKANAESNQFSVVNYVRYVVLYENLRVVANNNVDKLRWVARKVKALSKAYQSAVEILFGYLDGLDSSLTRIELAEPKGKAVGVSKDWVKLYKTINYVATHAPRDSDLANKALEYLNKSPNGTSDKNRATRYKLYSHAFH